MKEFMRLKEVLLYPNLTDDGYLIGDNRRNVDSITVFRPNGLFQKVDEVRKVDVRLESSRSGGDYYDLFKKRDDGVWIPENFGLNSAPYNPRFSIISTGLMYVRIVKELGDELSWLYEKVRWENKVDWFYLPLSRNTEKSLDDYKYMLIVGNCPVTGTHYMDTRDWLNRINEVYYFKDVINLYQARKELVEEIEKRKDHEVEYGYVQGHLQMKKLFVDKDLMDMIKIWGRRTSFVLFNHKVQFSRQVFVLPFDNKRYVVVDDYYDSVVFEMLSYDHKNVTANLEKGYIYEFEHPFPVRGNVD